MLFSDKDKMLIKKHINTLRIHSNTRSGIKIGTLKYNLFALSVVSAEYLEKI